METIIQGISTETFEEVLTVGSCTEEPGDNCWLQLD